MTKRLIAVVAVLLALFLTNPDREDFGHYLERRFEKERTESSGEEGGFGAWLGELMTDGVAKLLTKSAKRNDYLLFSIYTIGGETVLDGGEGRMDVSIDEKQRYLGLLGSFFALD